MHPILSKSDSPQQLKPSPPASQYILQYTKYKKSLIRQDIERSRESALLAEIQKLSGIIRERQQYFSCEKQTIMKNIVLLSLEVEHMRQVHSQYQYKLKVSEQTCGNMEEMYELKLQQIKNQLSDSFYQQLVIEKEKTMKDFLQLKQIYSSKIALISQSTKNKEIQLQNKTQQANQRAIRLQLYECKVNEKEKMILKYANRIAELEQDQIDKQTTISLLEQKIDNEQKQTNETINYLKIRAGDATRLYEEIHEQLLLMKNSNIQMEESIKKYEQDNSQLKNQLELTLRKMNKLQKQLDELNRKTYKNKELPTNNMLREEITERQRQRVLTQNQGALGNGNNTSLLIKIEELEQIVVEREEGLREANFRIEKYQSIIKEKQVEIAQLMNRLGDYSPQTLKFQEQNLVQKQTYIKQLEQQIKQIPKFKEQLSNMQKTLEVRQNTVEELREELMEETEEYGRKLILFNKKTSNLDIEWREKQKEMELLRTNIQNTYLKEISALKNQVEGLQKTLVDTNLMFETMEVQRNEGKKASKSKKKDKVL